MAAKLIKSFHILARYVQSLTRLAIKNYSKLCSSFDQVRTSTIPNFSSRFLIMLQAMRLGTLIFHGLNHEQGP